VLGFAVFVALIVTPHEHKGWDEPTITTWVLEAGRSSLGGGGR
jgi:hypothetical protein